MGYEESLLGNACALAGVWVRGTASFVKHFLQTCEESEAVEV